MYSVQIITCQVCKLPPIFEIVSFEWHTTYKVHRRNCTVQPTCICPSVSGPNCMLLVPLHNITHNNMSRPVQFGRLVRHTR